MWGGGREGDSQRCIERERQIDRVRGSCINPVRYTIKTGQAGVFCLGLIEPQQYI